MMETNVKLYALNFHEAKTYIMAAMFVACNVVLPQLFHLVPQGGIIFSPLSLVILISACKFGWKTGLLVAVISPLVNHCLFGQPLWSMLPVMTMKLAVLALVAGLALQHFLRVSLPLIAGIVLVAEAVGCIGELMLTRAIDVTIADFVIGWPGLLLQVVGAWLVLRIAIK